MSTIKAVFFTKSLQIIEFVLDNIGGDIIVDYYLLGSGRYSVPQMCALHEMKMNNFLQAQFLKCEAEGKPSQICLCESGIDPEKYRHCVLTKGNYASRAAAKYSQIGIEASPIVEVGYKNTIFGVDDSWYLKKICSMFGDNPPRGCIKPFSCDNSTIVITDRKGVVNFDCDCAKLDFIAKNPSEIDFATTSTTTINPEEKYP
ncbi:uncharacterized protein LOC112055927 [Bicyclus anynana]|uniref:Uncharacterized protein LOC112055927 n=1 Tax=Bicyclus anynana TaxID=110368 RepID=A0ABM3LZL4_BICAN|nr:uncharacterized protein LOC112055927 [Bicyclus anynana]